MEQEKINTLEQFQMAFEIVERERFNPNLSQSEKNKLKEASIKLKELESLIINQLTDKLIKDLTSGSKELKDLAVQIKKSADKLSNISKAIEKATNALDILICALGKLVSIGMI
jgi:hypothetical protein